ncbi:MAG: hypothetical protein ABJB01_11755 [Rudaea sp.]
MKKTTVKKAASKKNAAKKTAVRKSAKPRSRQIHARKSKDAQFDDLLRRKCVRAASIGALTAGAEAVPGLGRALGFFFGELVDATMLSSVQRDLVTETFEVYGFEVSDSLQSTLVDKIHIVGAGASVTADTAIRGLLKRGLGQAGSLLTHRLMPIAPIVTSALTNATITYAVGKRAQAIAKFGDTSMQGTADVIRAFTGVDERRVFEWTMSAIKGSTESLSNTFSRIKSKLTPRRKKQ